MGILAEFYRTVAEPLEDTDPRKAEILQVVANIPSGLEVRATAGFDGKIGKPYEITSPGYIVDAMISRAALIRHRQGDGAMQSSDIIGAAQADYPFIRRAVHVSSFYNELDA
jgi:hypothetical protein